jgi:hypothetical protein
MPTLPRARAMLLTPLAVLASLVGLGAMLVT